MCAFAVASGNRTICDFMGSDIQFANAKFLTTKGKEMPLQKLFPANCDLIRIQPELQSQTNKLQSRQIFKDTIYSESYLPILTFKDDVFLGFALPKASGEGGNAIRLIGKKPKQLLVDLADFLDRPYVPATHPVTYRIQPDKAHEFLVKAANKPESLTEQENKVLQLLIGLKFTTIKNTPQKVLSQNEKFVSKAAAEKIIDAKLAININSFGSKTKLGYSARGQLVLPTKHEWISLLNNQHMNALWSGTINDPKANFAMEEWLKSFIPSRLINSRKSSKLAHSRKKRTFSMPIITSASGGFIVESKPNLNDKSTRRLLAINVEKSVAFSASETDDGLKVIDWGKPLIRRELIHQKLIPAAPPFDKCSDKQVDMTEWRTIVVQDDLIVQCAPATIDRSRLKITMSFERLQRWFKVLEEEDQLDHPFKLKKKYKLRNIDKFLLVEPQYSDVLNKPKSKLIYINKVGSIVSLTYTVESRNKSIKEAFNQAKD